VSTSGLSQGQIIAAISAVAVIVSLFLAWQGVEGASDVSEALPDVPEGVPGFDQAQEAAEEAESSAEATGWEGQNTLDIYLAIVAGFILINVLMAMQGSPGGLPFAPPAATFLLGAIASVLMVYVLIDNYPEGAERKIGVYIATAAAIGMTVGSYLQLRDQVSKGY
jgi:hypothetical protein